VNEEDVPERSPGPNTGTGAAVVFCAAILVYGVALGGGFHYDDSHHVAENPAIRSLENVPAFFRDASTFSTIPNHRLYRPVLMTSFAIDWAIGGGATWVFLANNVLLHALNALLVLFIVRRVLGDDRAALFAGLIFAVHPLASEVVNYVSARSSSLATLFALLSILAVLRWDGKRTATARLWLVGSFALLALGLLTKAIAATAPILALLCYEARRVRKGREGSLMRSALALAPAALVLIGWYALVQSQLGNIAAGLAKRVVQQTEGGELSREKRSVAMNVWTQARVFWMYVSLTVVPVDLSIDRFVRVSTRFLDWVSILSLAGIAAAITLALRTTRRALRLGLLWFGVALLPTSSILPLLVVMNEHRVYLPLVGAAILGGALLAATSRRRGGHVVAVAAIAVLAVLSVVRTLDWRDDETLWQSALRVSPDSYQAHSNLGILRYNAARSHRPKPDVGLIDESIAYFERSREIFPGWFNASFNLGNAWLLRGQVTRDEADFDRAEAAYRDCLETSPGSFRARWHIAATNAARGRHELALAGFQELRDADDSRTSLYWWPIGRQLIELERFDEARATYAKIEAFDGPSDDLAYLRAELLEKSGQTDEAEAAFRALADIASDRVRAIGALVRFLHRTDRATPESLNALFERLLQTGYPPSREEAALFGRGT